MLDNIDKNTVMEAGFPNFLICIFLVLFQDFLWSKLRFSKAIISESEDYQMLYDYLSLQEKYSFLITYLFKKIPGFFQHFLIFFLFQTFPGLEIYLIIFLVSRYSRVYGNPGREASLMSRGHRVTVSSWVDFFLSIF